MSGIVLDASAIAAWCFEDESDPAADALLDRVATDGATVPALWVFEVANLLARAERRDRVDAARAATFLDRKSTRLNSSH